jgi:predicted GNAT family N-acyltransferase
MLSSSKPPDPALSTSNPSVPHSPTSSESSDPDDMTEFISFLAAQWEKLEKYDAKLRPDDQPDKLPLTFIDAMRVREIVFVKEQNVPRENEFDIEDARSYHWVAYASVGAPREDLSTLGPAILAPLTTEEAAQAGIVDGVPTPVNAMLELPWSITAAPPGSIPGFFPSRGSHRAEASLRNSASSATRIPIGTIRLIPPVPVYNRAVSYDHRESAIIARHRRASGDWNPRELDEDADMIEQGHNYLHRYFEKVAEMEKEPGFVELPHPTVYPNEPYIRLGRLAVIPEYRGNGVSKLMIQEVIKWAKNSKNLIEILPLQDPVEREEHRMAGLPIQQQWNGLIIVHAQAGNTVELWQKFGFEVDQGMGEWDEEGMMHVGMWKRIQLPDPKDEKETDWLKA